MKIASCPICGETPEVQSAVLCYFISCECHDPSPDYGTDLVPPDVTGMGPTEEDTIVSWNESVKEYSDILAYNKLGKEMNRQ